MELQYFLGIDYSTWWFLVVGGLFSGYAILDGFDFGAGMLHLFFKKEKSRRIALNAVGPVWDGNEVWLVIGGGALFAGFPVVYATLLSSLYLPFIFFLFFLIFRAISIEFRSKEELLWWRKMWDITYAVSSFMLAFLLGVVLGNVLQGIPITENIDVSVPFSQAVNPFTIMMGLTIVALFTMHGGIYLLMKTEGKLFGKVERITIRSILGFSILLASMSIYIFNTMPHLSDRFLNYPVLFIIPLLGMLSIANIPRLIGKSKYFYAFIFSALSISLFFSVVAIELYPSILISSIDPKFDITLYEAASSQKTLGIMLVFVAIGMPLVVSYTYFVYKTFKGKVILDKNSY